MVLRMLSYFFFFSSRRRHTRLQGDWSSDVCSSDLTKTPNQWREPVHAADEVARFRTALARAGIRPETVVAHDSYLINLASPDPRLRARSIRSFSAEVVRCGALGVPSVVRHPGNYIDDRAAGLE